MFRSGGKTADAFSCWLPRGPDGLLTEMSKKNVIVISGGPGFGKSELIGELKKLGYQTGEEYARSLIQQQMSCGGDVLPWKNMKQFMNEVMEQRIHFYQSVADGTVAFADRGLPDHLAFARYRGMKPPETVLENIRAHPYFPVVFITPPWKEIYSTDEVRQECFEEAELLHQFICGVYRELGYELAELPRTDPASRARFVTDYLS